MKAISLLNKWRRSESGQPLPLSTNSATVAIATAGTPTAWKQPRLQQRLLVTGIGRHGSWSIRGKQMGTALGATIRPIATSADIGTSDLVVVIKSACESLIDDLHRSRRPWVLDILDGYPQPESSFWDRGQAVAWVRRRIEQWQPTAVIWPTRRMQLDCEVELPSLVLPHHYRPGIARNPIRTRIGKIGYEGDVEYLDGWHGAVHDECRRRGWRFVVNPKSLADVDIVLALRGVARGGYVNRHWKSNVKLANAHGSGTPFIGQRECGYLETACAAELWAENMEELGDAFDRLTPNPVRARIAMQFLQAAYSLEEMAGVLKRFLKTLAD